MFNVLVVFTFVALWPVEQTGSIKANMGGVGAFDFVQHPARAQFAHGAHVWQS